MVPRRLDLVMALTIRRRRQGYESGGCVTTGVGAGCQDGQGRVMIDGIQNLRLDMIDLAIHPRDLRGRRGIDAAHQGGFLTQESDDLVDVMEGVAGDALVRDSVLKSGL